MHDRPRTSIASRSKAYVESLRLGLCGLVVFGHTQLDQVALAVMSVVGFFAISFTFSIDSLNAARLRTRIAAIVALWSAWCVPYAVLLALRGIAKHEGMFGLAEPYMLLTGPSIHLWYLPALALMGGILLLIGEFVRSTSTAALATLVVGCIAAMPCLELHIKTTPVPQLLVAAFALAATLAGTRWLPSRQGPLWGLAGISAVLVAFAIGSLLATNWPAWVLMCFGVICICRCQQPETPPWLTLAASVTTGVYLFHAIPLLGFHWIGLQGWPLFVATLSTSVMVTAVARGTPLRRFF